MDGEVFLSFKVRRIIEQCCNEGGGSIKKLLKARNALFQTGGL